MPNDYSPDNCEQNIDSPQKSSSSQDKKQSPQIEKYIKEGLLMPEIKEEKQEDTPINRKQSSRISSSTPDSKALSNAKKKFSPRNKVIQDNFTQGVIEEQLHSRIMEHLLSTKISDSEVWRENQWEKYKHNIGLTFQPKVSLN